MNQLNIKKIIVAITILLGFQCVFPHTAWAQTGKVSGTINTSDGKFAAKVNVQLKELKKTVITDSMGAFTFENVKAGKQTIVASFSGLQTITKNILVIENTNTTIDLTLAENETQLNEVIIYASKSINERTTNAGKIDIKPMDLPQSITVINKDVLQKQQVLQLSDALQNVTGVYVMGTTGGYQEEIAGRGYAFTSSNTFKNGVRFNNAAIPELSGVEKIEFLKGGSAILYGNVAAGGILNIVTKKPLFEQGGEVSFRAGSFGFYKPSVDIYGPVNKQKTVAFRINSSYQKAASFRDDVSSERYYINPSILAKLGSKTTLLLEADYLKDNRTPDFGIGAQNYVIPNVPRSRFIGVPWGYNKVTQTSATATLTHQLNKSWQVNTAVGYQKYDAELFAAARPSAVLADGKLIRGLQKSKSSEKYYLGQVDFIGKIKTGTVKHTILIGADADKYSTETYTFLLNKYNSALANTSIRTQNIYDTINIFDPSTFNQRQDVPYLATDRINTSPITRVGVYVQDLVSVSEKLKVLAGVRYSNQQNQKATVDSVSRGTKGSIDAFKSDACSPKLGIVYQPVKQVSIFASYTNSFIVNTGVDVNNQSLKPSVVNQYEVGIKTDVIKGLLSANVTAYKIINSNFSQAVLPAPANIPAARELAGEVTSNGLEIDIATKQIAGFTFIAGYSYNQTTYTKSNIYKEGERLRYNPTNTANANVDYQFAANTALKGFSLNAGGYFVGDRLAGRNPSSVSTTNKIIELPDYFLFDAGVGYRFNNITLRLKVTNIFNRLSYNVHDDNSINPIAPSQIVGTVSFKF